VKKQLLEQSPDLNPGNYGYSRLRDFLLASGIVEMHRIGNVVLVRLWDDCELGPASKDERDRNVRQILMDPPKTKKGTPLKSNVEHEHEQGRGLDTSLALVALEAEDDESRTPLAGEPLEVQHSHEHETPVESKDNNGSGHETSLPSTSPLEESDVYKQEHEHDEHQTPLESEDERKVEHETSSVTAPATLHISLKHEDEQQGIGMPLMLDFGPEHDDTSTPLPASKDDEHETSITWKNNEPEHEHKISLAQEDEPEHEISTSLDSEAEHKPEPEVEPEPKPKTMPLASLAQTFSYSERR
jgi:hypothetical protein